MGTTPETRRLLTAADYFLQRRNFLDCSKYAARARDSDPTNPAVTRILSTAAVLSAPKISATHHDYYAILNLPYFESDASRIGCSFETLTSILDPNTNPCPFSSEAFDLAVNAWSVLSNPVEKAKFDAEMRAYMGGACTSGSASGTFWTMCPYCYHVYEYDRVFEDCCLRCSNERCRRVLHAVPIGGPPPPDVVAKGQYCCPGFMPFSLRTSTGEAIKDEMWAPFAPSHHVGKGLDLNSASYGDCIVVLDDNNGFERTGFQDHGNGDKAKFEGKCENAGVGVRMKRKKSVPWKSKKLLGRGISINGDEARFVYGVREESCSNVDKDEGEVSKACFGGEEFLDGDDDIFISLPCDFDLGNGEPMSL